MGIRVWIRNQLLDLAMRQMNELRPEALSGSHGEVLEVGFGTGLNLAYYPPSVTSLTALDPNVVDGLPAVERRLSDAPFAVERCPLRADGELPFDSGRFDTIVTTWTLCSIPDPHRALVEMRRILKPGGKYLFIEHGRASLESTARWQDRVNPLWKRLSDGCNVNRSIDEIVEKSGFELDSLERFRHQGPAIFAQMYRGCARHSG